MRVMALVLSFVGMMTAGCSQSSVSALESRAIDTLSAQAVRGLRQEKRLIYEKHEQELQNAESIYASANGLPLQQVKENPTPETIQGVEQLRSKIRERRERYLRQIDAEIAKLAASSKLPARSPVATAARVP